MGKKEFEEVSIPKWKLAVEVTADKIYRVFKTEEDFQEIEAGSANEAIQKSGVENVFQVRIGAMDRVEILDQSLLSLDEIDSESSSVPQDIADDIPLEAASAGTEGAQLAT